MKNKALMSLIENQKGFTIASVMVAASIGAFVILGISTALQNSLNTASFIEDKQSSMDLKNELTIDLSDGAACANTLSGRLVDEKIASLRNKANQVLFADGKYDRLNIGSMYLQNVDVPAAPNGTGRVNMFVEVERSRGPASQSLKQIKIPISVTLDATSRIASCAAAGSSELASEARKCMPSGKMCGIMSVMTGGCTKKVDEGTTKEWSTGGSAETGGGDQHRAVCINGKWVSI